jgi:hypothetical protein
LQSLSSYRQALAGFVRALPDWLAQSRAEADGARARGSATIEGGLA